MNPMLSYANPNVWGFGKSIRTPKTLPYFILLELKTVFLDLDFVRPWESNTLLYNKPKYIVLFFTSF